MTRVEAPQASTKRDETPEHLAEVRRIVHRRTGILLGPQKEPVLRRHIDERTGCLGLGKPDDYVRFLLYFDASGLEFQRLVNAVTVNETYFFRDFGQLRVFAEHCLPRLAEAAIRSGRDKLRLLSAGCATGEEVYTLSIVLLEMLEEYEGLSFDILGVDIDDGVLAVARRGVYDRRSVKDVPLAYLERHFERLGGRFVVGDPVRRHVRFVHANIAPPGAVAAFGQTFDAVFCRNVFIYFDDLARRQALRNLYEAMLPGAFVFLGHAEFPGRIDDSLFEAERVDDLFVYRKPGGVK